MAIIPGYALGCAFTTDGLQLAGPQTIVVTEHDWKEQIAELEVPNSSTLGMDAVIAGLLKGEGQVKGYSDNLALIWAVGAFIRAGVTGTLRLGIGSLGQPFLIPSIVTQLHHAAVVDGKMQWDFSVKLSAYAGTGIYFRAT